MKEIQPSSTIDLVCCTIRKWRFTRIGNRKIRAIPPYKIFRRTLFKKDYYFYLSISLFPYQNRFQAIPFHVYDRFQTPSPPFQMLAYA